MVEKTVAFVVMLGMATSVADAVIVYDSQQRLLEYTARLSTWDLDEERSDSWSTAPSDFGPVDQTVGGVVDWSSSYAVAETSMSSNLGEDSVAAAGWANTHAQGEWDVMAFASSRSYTHVTFHVSDPTEVLLSGVLGYDTRGAYEGEPHTFVRLLEGGSVLYELEPDVSSEFEFGCVLVPDHVYTLRLEALAQYNHWGSYSATMVVVPEPQTFWLVGVLCLISRRRLRTIP